MLLGLVNIASDDTNLNDNIKWFLFNQKKKKKVFAL